MFPQNSCPLLFPPINKQPLPFYPKDDNNDIDSRKEIHIVSILYAKCLFGKTYRSQTEQIGMFPSYPRAL